MLSSPCRQPASDVATDRPHASGDQHRALRLPATGRHPAAEGSAHQPPDVNTVRPHRDLVLALRPGQHARKPPGDGVVHVLRQVDHPAPAFGMLVGHHGRKPPQQRMHRGGHRFDVIHRDRSARRAPQRRRHVSVAQGLDERHIHGEPRGQHVAPGNRRLGHGEQRQHTGDRRVLGGGVDQLCDRAPPGSAGDRHRDHLCATIGQAARYRLKKSRLAKVGNHEQPAAVEFAEPRRGHVPPEDSVSP